MSTETKSGINDPLKIARVQLQSSSIPSTSSPEEPHTPTKDEKQDPDDPPSPAAAWLQVLFSHLTNVNTFGVILSFGVFQGYYTTQLNYSATAASWIGTTQLFLAYFLGILSGRLFDAGFYRVTLPLGLACQILGALGASFASTRWWRLWLAQGLLMGVGNGLLFTPAFARVAGYFPVGDRNRALAQSLVACGGATGGMAYPALARALLPRIGFAWTVRAMALIMLCVAGVSLAGSRARPVRKEKQPLLDTKAFRDVDFVLYGVGIFFSYWGLFFAYYYVRLYGLDIILLSSKTSFDTIIEINALGIPGRILPAVLADRYFGPNNALVPCILISGVLQYFWIAVTTPAGLFAWVAFYGFFAGGVQGLASAGCAVFASNPRKVGTRIGMVYTLLSFACLTGPPICGKLIELRNGNYLYAQVFGATSMVTGGALIFAAGLLRKP
jgi:MFS family permease